MVINIVMPGTHLSRLKDNRGRCRQSQRHLDIVLSFGTVKTTPTSQRLEQGDSLGERPVSGICLAFQIHGILVAKNDLKILGSVPGIFKESNLAVKESLV